MMDTFDCTILGYAKTHFLDGEVVKEQNLAKVIHVLQKILAAGAKARKEGLLALEEFANENKSGTELADKFFAQGLLLIVDGTDPEFVREILSNQIAVQGPDTLEGYLFYLIMNGCLNIQAGVNPRLIEEIMYSYLPLSLVDRVSKVIRQEQEGLSESYKQQLVQRWNKYQPKETDNPFIGLLEEKMAFYSDKEIQRILQEVSFDDIRSIVAYCKTDIKNRISDNLTDNVKANIMDDMWFVSESDLTPALDNVLRAINKLEAYGEIREKAAKIELPEGDLFEDDFFEGLFSEEGKA